MSNETKHWVYSNEVIEMVTVGVQYCLLLEQVEGVEKRVFIDKMARILPLLYLKTIMVENKEMETDSYLENFVTEDDYNLVRDNIATLLGNDDAYLEVFVDGMRYSDTPITSFISENLADIYQELKDLAGNFRSGEEYIMSEAMINCQIAFKNHWGQKLTNVMRAMHALYVADNDEDGI